MSSYPRPNEPKKSLPKGPLQTFYIATSFTNKSLVTKISEFFRLRRMRWSMNHDWSKWPATSHDDASATFVSSVEILAVTTADLFVFIPSKPLSVGCHVELGARLAAGREVHLIREGETDYHLFHGHPGIVRHKSFADFALTVFGA